MNHPEKSRAQRGSIFDFIAIYLLHAYQLLLPWINRVARLLHHLLARIVIASSVQDSTQAVQRTVSVEIIQPSSASFVVGPSYYSSEWRSAVSTQIYHQSDGPRCKDGSLDMRYLVNKGHSKYGLTIYYPNAK